MSYSLGCNPVCGLKEKVAVAPASDASTMTEIEFCIRRRFEYEVKQFTMLACVYPANYGGSCDTSRIDAKLINQTMSNRALFIINHNSIVFSLSKSRRIDLEGLKSNFAYFCQKMLMSALFTLKSNLIRSTSLADFRMVKVQRIGSFGFLDGVAEEA